MNATPIANFHTMRTQSRHALRRVAAVLALCIGACTSQSVLAVDFGATGDGNWNDPSIWTPAGGPPGAGDRAFIGTNSPAGSVSMATITLTANQDARSVTLGRLPGDDGTLDLANFVLSLTETLHIGSGVGAIARSTGHFETANLTVSGGNPIVLDPDDVITSNLTVEDAGSQVTLVLPLNVTSDITISEDGTLDAAGQDITASRIFLGNSQGGGILTNDGAITVGLIQIQESAFALDANDRTQDLTITTGAVVDITDALNVERHLTVSSTGSLALAAPLQLTGDLNIANGGTVDAAGQDIAANRVFVGSQAAGGSLLNDASITTNELRIENGSFAIDSNDSITDLRVTTGSATLDPTTELRDLNLISNSTLTTINATSINRNTTVSAASQLTLSAPLTLTGDLNITNNGIVDAAGQNIVANRIFIGNSQAGGALLNDAAITTTELRIENGSFAIDADDAITDLRVTTGSVTLDPSTELRDLILVSNSTLTTINATSINRNATVSAGSQLTLSAPLTLTGDLNISNNGVVDAAGQPIVANRVLVGNFQAGAMLLNKAGIATNELRVEKGGFVFDANDDITDLRVTDGTATLDPTTELRDLTLISGSTLTTINAMSVNRNATVTSGSQLTLVAPLTVSGDLNIANGGIVDAAGRAIVANRILIGNFQAGGTLLNDAALTAVELRVQKGAFTLDADDQITDLRVTDGVVTLDATTQLRDVTLATSATLSTVNATSVSRNATITSGSQLTLSAPLTLTGDLNIPNNGVFDAAGHAIVANRVLIGNFQAGGMLLNDAAITTVELRVQKGAFTLDADDQTTDLRVTDGTVVLDPTSQIRDVVLDDNATLTTINATSINRNATILDGSQLTLAAPLTLSGNLNMPNNGVVDAAGQDIVANRIFIGNFQSGGTLQNDGAIDTPRLRLERESIVSLTGANDVMRSALEITGGSSLTYMQGANETLGLSLEGDTLDILDTSVLTLDLENILDAHYVSGFQWKNPLGGDRVAELEGLIASGRIVIDSSQAGDVEVFVGSFGFTHIGIFNTIPGDYDRNGTVDSDDYAFWRAAFGSSVAAPGFGADGNFDGIVSAGDYAVWRENLGRSLPLESSTAAPEPASMVALAIAGLVLLSLGMRRR